MKCCPSCFTDFWLQNQIRYLTNTNGACDFCSAQKDHVIDPISLRNLFESLIDLYIEDTSGTSLVNLLQDDWQVFASKIPEVQIKLLSEITGIEGLAVKRFQCRILPGKDKVMQWTNFQEELKHRNRYFPKSIPDVSEFTKSFSFLSMPQEQVPRELFRARIDRINGNFRCEDMGMPPSHLVGNGRANPRGISYLYVASDLDTAVSEVRPFIGDKVSVAVFKVIADLAILDIQHPKKTISPFQAQEEVSEIYVDMPFLELLGIELSKPVFPESADLEYLPSQYLCELAKHLNYDGIAYQSSIAKGFNIALFNQEKVKCESISTVTVDNVKTSYS